MHGGAAPQVIARAAERQVEAKVRRALAAERVTPVSDPVTALSELAGEVVAMKNYLLGRLNYLDADSWRYEGLAGSEQLRAEVALYERALDRTARLLAEMARLNLSERLARIAEEQGEQLVAVLRASLLDLGVDPDAEIVREVVGRHIRAVTTGGAA